MLSSYSEPLTIQPSELWEVKTSTERRETCCTVFHYKYLSKTDDLVSKWYYPKDFPVQPFDLANNSTQIWFSIYEDDPSGTREETIITTSKYTKTLKDQIANLVVQILTLTNGLWAYNSHSRVKMLSLERMEIKVP